MKEQEASHLSLLLAIMVRATTIFISLLDSFAGLVSVSVCVSLSQSAGELKGGGIDEKDLELSEDEEESEDDQSSGDSEGETPTNQTFVVKGTKSDDSLSLRAQIVSNQVLANHLLIVAQTQRRNNSNDIILYVKFSIRISNAS